MNFKTIIKSLTLSLPLLYTPLTCANTTSYSFTGDELKERVEKKSTNTQKLVKYEDPISGHTMMLKYNKERFCTALVVDKLDLTHIGGGYLDVSRYINSLSRNLLDKDYGSISPETLIVSKMKVLEAGPSTGSLSFYLDKLKLVVGDSSLKRIEDEKLGNLLLSGKVKCEGFNPEKIKYGPKPPSAFEKVIYKGGLLVASLLGAGT